MQRGGYRTILFLIYLVLGLYFLNVPFEIITLPAVNEWIIFVGGALLIFGGFKYLGLGRHFTYGGY